MHLLGGRGASSVHDDDDMSDTGRSAFIRTAKNLLTDGHVHNLTQRSAMMMTTLLRMMGSVDTSSSRARAATHFFATSSCCRHSFPAVQNSAAADSDSRFWPRGKKAFFVQFSGKSSQNFVHGLEIFCFERLASLSQSIKTEHKGRGQAPRRFLASSAPDWRNFTPPFLVTSVRGPRTTPLLLQR